MNFFKLKIKIKVFSKVFLRQKKNMIKKVYCKLIEHSILKEKLNMRLYKIIRINSDINSDDIF